jgi:hypothetical protein
MHGIGETSHSNQSVKHSGWVFLSFCFYFVVHCIVLRYQLNSHVVLLFDETTSVYKTYLPHWRSNQIDISTLGRGVYREWRRVVYKQLP